MYNYYFCSTFGEQWIFLTEKLFRHKIAKPILWIGDDTNYNKARKLFNEAVFKREDMVHHPYKLKDINYNGELNHFFDSENYLRAKDICLKMMDRLDIYGTFNRINREAYFHSLLIFYLKKISLKKPDLFLCVENPHSHAQFLLLEICLYLKIPCYKLNNWMVAPLLFAENIATGKKISFSNKNIPKVIEKKIYFSIQNFINELNTKKEDYEIHYMKSQREQNRLRNKIKIFFSKKFFNELRDIKHNVGLKLYKKQSYINPYYLSYPVRFRIRSKRKKILKSHLKKATDNFNFERKYVYFPLHFEPERTTTPDGGLYHDQFKALSKLREILPKEILIVVKEHPSQFYFTEKGSIGRSPLFYGLIKNINNLMFVNHNYNTIKLILNSEFVATITGTVALEAAILDKNAICFGDPWFKGFPNVFSIKNSPKYSELSCSKIHSHDEKFNFFKKLYLDYSIPCFINASSILDFDHEYSKEIPKSQNELIFELYKSLFNKISL